MVLAIETLAATLYLDVGISKGSLRPLFAEDFVIREAFRHVDESLLATWRERVVH